MPLGKLFAAVTYGAAFGLFPIGWVVLPPSCFTA